MTLDEKLKILSTTVEKNHTDVTARLGKLEESVRASADAFQQGLKALGVLTKGSNEGAGGGVRR